MINSPYVLIVDDEPDFLHTLGKRLSLRNFRPLLASSAAEAIEIAKHHPLNMAIVDYSLTDLNGVELAVKLKKLKPNLQVTLVTGYAKEASQKNETIPIIDKSNLDELWNIIGHFTPENKISPKSNPTASRIPWIIGETQKIQKLKKNLNKIAILDCPILIVGETGTGKELIARTLHSLSFRKQNKFIAIHCSTFNPEILLKEIFGEEHEDLEGTTRKRIGLLEVAEGGTLFLDEIENAPLMIQSMILKFIEKKSFIPYGGNREVKVDVRIIAATNGNLIQKVKEGQFREDLYFRLNAVSLELPPLRERKDDIPLLAYYFLNKYAQEFGKNVNKISEEVLNTFKNYDFPGNVRELEYAIERAVILAENEEITLTCLPSRFKNPSSPIKNHNLKTLDEIEKEYILKVLKFTKGSKNEAAKILGISRTSLWRKLKLYNLDQ
ncbi:DNA-binding transcriptional response regulator, NtrC family, contains REC, AAA-type ATPase, and a Fis-type DNA-binding domains [Desulfonauticus submarinus]|uniref:DNA-binding transcriptional response regulator, NtrC family, contains REC, AAA-type ATPase, and a Fis-type DNA-binding domains n=1 Tax=Desulfonauticus submarinus TaxID=206665 RepID=A0A1H0FL44_9BACT|nr:sigma-54 dependent transcriptional regulator [Desulfonauticus submarinus]SDN95272.1 DNA-binding transcriptional response regulator, NtrC family, contains REC, AAA-type ATPase, and a Fis-type DNA-binding domains [Desulfonauticus submarinus]